MALVTCRECGKQISSDARACPHCGKVQPDRSEAARMKFWAWFFVVFLIAVAAFNVSEYFKRGQPRSVDKASIAYSECRTAIRLRLKAPSTADFPIGQSADYVITGDTVIVTSFVDAQNSYGAKLRSTWRCKALVGDAGSFIVYATLLD
jgi:hypothetical protein